MAPALIGIGLAACVAAFARFIGFDRERSFYPLVLIIVASYYALFAAMAGATSDMLPELLFVALFVAGAVAGFRRSLWIVVAGLAAHGIFDFARGGFLPGSGVPDWWPSFCAAYDVTAAVLLAAVLLTDRRPRPAAIVLAPRR